MTNQKNKPLDKNALKQPDEFQVLNTKLITWIIRHKTLVIAIVVVILLSGAGFSGFRYHKYIQETTVSELTANTLINYRAMVQDGDTDAFDKTNAAFLRILNTYGNTKNAVFARMALANIAYAAAKYEIALENYEIVLKAVRDDVILMSTIQNSLGYCYLALGQDDNAMQAFEKVAKNKSGALQDDALYNLGLIYEKLGETQKSTSAFDQIQKDYPDGLFAQLLKNRVVN